MFSAKSMQGCAHASRTTRGAWGTVGSSVNRGLAISLKRLSSELATDVPPPGNPGS